MGGNRAPLIEAALDLAWSHWVALGVRGMPRPPSTAVDPEALLYLTATLVAHDPRLQAEVADWWNQFERYVSRPRLNSLATRFGEQIAAKLEALLSSFRTTTRTGKSRLDHLGTPGRSLLRLRCAFGANARAEVLLEFLTRRSDDGLTALALSEVGYSKRNVATILEDLRLGGILVSSSEGNRLRYRLADSDGLQRVLRPIPASPGRWHARLPIVAMFVELSERLRGRSANVQGIEARKTLEHVRSLLAAAGATSLGPTATVESYWDALQHWLVETIIADDSDSDHRIDGMLEGTWIGPHQRVQRPERFSSAVLPRVTANPDNDQELVCLDLVQVSTVGADDWAWAVMSTAATSTYTHTIGLNDREPWRFVTWASGDARTYKVDYAEPLPQDQIARLYGAPAASRARPDKPAVQLRLSRIDREP